MFTGMTAISVKELKESHNCQNEFHVFTAAIVWAVVFCTITPCSIRLSKQHASSVPRVDSLLFYLSTPITFYLLIYLSVTYIKP